MPETPDDKKRTTPPDPDTERDVRIDINIGGLMGNLNDLMNAVNEAMQEAQRRMGENSKSGWKVESDPDKGTFGFSFSTNLEDFVQSGGTTRTTVRSSTSRTSSRTTARSTSTSSHPTSEPQVREPLVDLFDEGDEIIVVAEMPGVQMSEIRVTLNEDVLALETTGDRRYMKELLLPAAVDPTTIQQTYRNGILELRLQRQQD